MHIRSCETFTLRPDSELPISSFRQGIILRRALKKHLAASAPPALFLAIAAYFVWNAVHGQGGLIDQQRQSVMLAQAQQKYASVDAQRLEWETRIGDLSGQSVTPDMLDSQARRVLNLADPTDLVVDLSARN
jgi:cell division protein FtsB